MSSIFVINEWIFHDLQGENGTKAQEEAYEFMQTLVSGSDQIAALRGTTWTQKAYALMKESDPSMRMLSKYLHLAIIQDLRKCVLLNQAEVKPLAEEIREQIPQKDRYLFDTSNTVAKAPIITGDRRLIEMVKQAQIDFDLRHRDNFLEEYLK